MRRMRILAWTVGLIACVTATHVNAQSVTAPAAQTVVASGSEWVTKTFQDPVDMNQLTDLSWWVFAADGPAVYLSGVSYGQCTEGASTTKCFKATTTSTGSNFWIHETGNPGSTRMGRTGDSYPIDASTHKVVAMRMRLSNTGSVCAPPSPKHPNCDTSFLWNKVNLYETTPVTQTNAVSTYDGWAVYLIDLTTIGLGTGSTAWSGTIGDLRYNLQAMSGASVEIDWIRLVPNNLPTQTISWSGFSSNVDLYLDDNTTASDGNVGLIVTNGVNTSVPAYNLSGSSYTFQPGMLAPGDYYVEICPTGTNPATGSGCKYSSGFYRVNDTPTFAFTSPSTEGSTDDFATVQLNQPWDMTSLSQVDENQQHYITNLAAATLDALDEAGSALGTVNVLRGTSLAAPTTGSGDPYMYFLWSAGDGKGRFKKIDASRYHILTVEMGVPDLARDINTGSIARMVWQVEGESPKENVSADIIFNSRAGVNVMAKFTTSMKTCAPGVTEWNHCLLLETDAGATPSTTGWTGNIENFRFDPHEYSAATPFYVRRIKLAANEKSVSNAYTIQWTYTDVLAPGTPTLTLSYDTDIDPSSGLVQIATGINPASASSYVWNTTGVPNGTYYIYASVSDGSNTNAAYSRWPIIVNSATTTALLPRMALNRSRLDTAGSDNGRVVTPPQTVSLAITGTGASSVKWKVTASDASVLVSPATGTGPGTFTVTMATSTIYPSNLVGDYYVKVEESVAGTTSNSAQYIRVVFKMYAKTGTAAPFGSFDTPAGGATGLQGSFAVTGWALDDIGITKVEIWRNLVSGEPASHAYTSDPSHPAYGKVYIADALFVNGSRPDIESGYVGYPFVYRSGWGYLLLSWGLEGQGNGTYVLSAYAYDKDGRSTLLGTKTIGVDNAHATKPFGAIDTPTYGGSVSGSFWNFGWALTPSVTPTCTIQNGRVYMNIDSGPFVTVNYGDLRADIAASFPGFSNGNNSGGAYYVDSTAYSNGTHQIGWLVYDDCNRGDGVGSRFFDVLNAGSRPAARAVSTPEASAARMAATRPSGEPVEVRQQLDGEWAPVWPSAAGPRVIEVAQDGRIEVRLPAVAGGYVGYSEVGGARRALPLGSSLDRAAGVFYWQPAAGFLGAYALRFVAADGTDVAVRVVVGPPMRLAVDTPAAGAVTAGVLTVAGWVVDLASEAGAGVDTVHIWAYPLGGAAPTFLGEAVYGDPRPDVAALYGAEAERSAFTLSAAPLPAGTYDVVVYARRAKTGTFDAAQGVRVTVR